MKILIIGKDGLLGHDLACLVKESGYSVIGTDRNELDITNKDEVARFFQKHDPDVIINCAVISPKACEKNFDLAFAVNVQGVFFFHKGRSKLIQFSSPAVFDNLTSLKNIQYICNVEYGYREGDAVDARSVYGKTKVAMEEFLRGSDCLILRTSWIYTKKLPFGLANIEEFPLNEIGRPTYSRDIWNIIKIGISEKLAGIYHVCGPEIMSRYEQARIFNNKDVKQSYLEQDNIRPLSILKIQPFLKKYEIELTKWPEAVKTNN
jgi:dTDP-4-dehydrorhamnose reductase